MSAVPRLLVVATGLALTGGAAVAVVGSAPEADFVVTTVASPPVSVPPSVTATAPAAQQAPARLRIPALRVDAPVRAVGVDDRTGEVAIPADVASVGWYRFGPGFAATGGSIVIAGHVDSADQGEGAFFRLGSLAEGDTVTLTGPGGRTRAFAVVARERYRKTAIPLDRYFARDGAPRLTLITCGGPFDTATRHYRDNVVITAAEALGSPKAVDPATLGSRE
ncbi:class F sortase [Actinoplanes sp. G11-F43]|uniref:class F sortase n=1 Tax=Actinoplanes sp. G11-F43 TaxID=3424130 RepID=UPI003D339B91